MSDEDRVTWFVASADGTRIGRKGELLVVEWPGIGRLLSSKSGDDVEFTAVAGANASVLEKLRVTGILACRRYLRGRLSLHGSAVGLSSGSVVFVGDSGAGKSTTAMALVERHGGTFLADDVVPIDWEGTAAVVSPVEDSIWLNADASAWFGMTTASSEKRACLPRARSAQSERLAAIVHLVFDETIDGADIHPVTGREAFGVLSSAHVCYSTGEDEDTLRNFAARARLADATKVLRLRRRRTLEVLSETASVLEAHLSGRGVVAGHQMSV